MSSDKKPEKDDFDFKINEEDIKRVQPKQKKEESRDKRLLNIASNISDMYTNQKSIRLNEEEIQKRLEQNIKSDEAEKLHRDEAQQNQDEENYLKEQTRKKKKLVILASASTLFFSIGFYQWHFVPGHGIVGELLAKTGIEAITPRNYIFHQMYLENLEKSREIRLQKHREWIDEMRDLSRTEE